MPTSTRRPVVKWAGGKTQLLEPILEALPRRIGTYFEPFAGGAAVFFALAAERRFERAVISDMNAELCATYSALQADVERVIAILADYQESHDSKFYYDVRKRRPEALSDSERAARFIYLNKTGFNGLYRVNRSGQFNVPLGRYAKPHICDVERLRAAAGVLRGVEIGRADFAEMAQRARRGDAVYFDPPYLPVSRTANFSAYDPHPFGMEEHRRLATVFAGLAAKKVRVVLSNSSTPDAKQLYASFDVRELQAKRNINSKVTGRGPVSELLVVAGPR